MTPPFSKIFRYDTLTGWLYWAIKPAQRVKIGDRACSYDPSSKYLRVRFKGKQYLAHRVIWFLQYKNWPKYQIDHIDGNKTNNRIANLRDVSRSQNMRNIKTRKHNKYGVNGVSFMSQRGKYIAQMWVNKKYIYLGLFERIEDAIRARKQAEIKYNYRGLNE